MDDLGVKSWQGQDIYNFSLWSREAMGLTQLSVQWVSGFFP